MLTTVLFDLDGTLLPMDAEAFERIYFHHLCQVRPDWPPEQFIQAIWVSVKKMVMDTELTTNETVFYNEYRNHIDCPLEEIIPDFVHFYEHVFVKAKEATWQSRELQEAVQLLIDKRYTLGIATNPLFPLTAIMQRIAWAGFQPEQFAYISTFEESHYCKPQLLYYQEILTGMGKAPEECLMVGNDEFEDMIAIQCGIQTYLLEGCVVERTTKPIPTYRGDPAAFLSFVQALPVLS